MNPKGVFAVMMSLVMAASLVTVAPASSQIKEWEQSLGKASGDHLGWSVSGGCDLNEDGVPDLIVGSPHSDSAGLGSIGRVCVFSGANCDLICILHGEEAGDQFGYSVSCAGDVDDDGTPDFLVGAPGYDNYRGKVYIYSGETFSLLHTFLGEATGDKFGFSVSKAGKSDDDGCDDLVVGAPGADYAALTACGKVYLYHGCSWTKSWEEYGGSSYDSLGYSVTGGCDINNDGYDDVIVGAPYFDLGLQTDRGRAHGFSGYDATWLCWPTGENSNDHLGWSVSSVGYFDSDSKCDFTVGAPGYNSGAGKAYVLEYASAQPERITVLCNVPGAQSGDSLGWSVSGAGDVDNNGRADVIIGAPGVSNGKGKAYVHLGDDCAFHCDMSGEADGDKLGFSVSKAGDVSVGTKGDGYDDVIIGAPYADSGCVTNGGKGYLYSGQNDCIKLCTFNSILPCVNIISPEDGECLQAASSYNVRWDNCYAYLSPQVKICTKRIDGAWGCEWTENDGLYEWPVPDDNSCLEWLIRIHGTGDCPGDTHAFTIANMTVTSPNGGETLSYGDVDTIRWTSFCITGNVWIQLSVNGGISWLPIANDTQNDGQHEWIIPCRSSGNCLVRVCGYCETGSLCDTSDSAFSISCPIPALTEFGVAVLVMLLMGTAIWIIKRRTLATQRNKWN